MTEAERISALAWFMLGWDHAVSGKPKGSDNPDYERGYDDGAPLRREAGFGEVLRLDLPVTTVVPAREE